MSPGAVCPLKRAINVSNALIYALTKISNEMQRCYMRGVVIFCR
jgi:hypothetical protein